MIKSRRMRWAGHVARMGEKRNAFRILVGKPEGSHVMEWVTIDGVWIGNRICWTLQHKIPDYTLQITVTHRLVFSVTNFTALLGNGFQQWSFLCNQADVHLTQTSYPANCRTLSLDWLVMAVGPRYIASTRTAQRIPLATYISLRACLLRP
jgi:hypothetical protein